MSIRSGDSISLDQVRVCLLVGSLSNNDGHGYENVPQKMKSCCIKLYRAYSTSFNSSNVGNLFWSWNFWKTVAKCRKGERKSLCLRSPQNVNSDSAFSRRSRAATAKKCTIKRDACADCCCFANLNLLLFCRSGWRRRRRCLSFLVAATGVVPACRVAMDTSLHCDAWVIVGPTPLTLDHYKFLRNCPPTPPQSQYFPLERGKR